MEKHWDRLCPSDREYVECSGILFSPRVQQHTCNPAASFQSESAAASTQSGSILSVREEKRRTGSLGPAAEVHTANAERNMAADAAGLAYQPAVDRASS